MIFTIGYQRITPAQLLDLAERLAATLLDVRSVPWSRKPGFTGKALAAACAARGVGYVHRPELGGRADIRGADLLAFAKEAKAEDAEGRNQLLMCMEDAPGDCHRHHAIAMPLLAVRAVPGVFHVMLDSDGGEVFRAEDLQRAIDEGGSYPMFGVEDAIEAGRELPKLFRATRQRMRR